MRMQLFLFADRMAAVDRDAQSNQNKPKAENLPADISLSVPVPILSVIRVE